MVNPQLNINKEITVTYNGIKSTPGDKDNLPTKEHEFIVVTSGHSLRYKDIKLLQKASPVKGKQYVLGFESDDLYLPASITVNGVLFVRKANRIVSYDQSGNKTNLSDRPVITRMGQALRAHNLKLKAEGKPPIKPIKRKW